VEIKRLDGLALTLAAVGLPAVAAMNLVLQRFERVIVCFTYDICKRYFLQKSDHRPV